MQHEVLYSTANQYEVLEFLGRGTFGQVREQLLKVFYNISLYFHTGAPAVAVQLNIKINCSSAVIVQLNSTRYLVLSSLLAYSQ